MARAVRYLLAKIAVLSLLVLTGQPALARDWVEAPAIVEHHARGRLYALSDAHGRYDQVVALLEAHGLIAFNRSRAEPSNVVWTGGDATVVKVGDLINKGPKSIELIDLFRSLQKQAKRHGGKVIVTMGNHEQWFLHDPDKVSYEAKDGKFTLSEQLRQLTPPIEPTDVAKGIDAEGRGKWLHDLPMAAKVITPKKSLFFVHSGDTMGMTMDQLRNHIEREVDEHGVGGAGALADKSGSILGGRNWARAARTAKHNAQMLGVDMMVMGHVPFALGKEGVGRLARTRWLLKLDGWMARPGFEGPAAMMAVRPSDGRVRQLDQVGRDTRMKYLPAAMWRYHALRAGLPSKPRP